MNFAPRLVNELMLVSVLVAGQGAEQVAEALSAEGAAAETLGAADAPGGHDLALFLAAPGSLHDLQTRDVVARLAAASDRLLFAPLASPAADPPAAPDLAELTGWFELFAELGYQPMVEFDAGFVSPGAFLVDRSATAAESELAAFADRLQQGEPAGVRRQEIQPAEPSSAAEQDDLRSRLAVSEAARDSVHAELADLAERAAAATRAAATADAAWEGLRAWVRCEVADPGRDTRTTLARDLPALNALRAPDAAPIVLAAVARRSAFGRLFGSKVPAADPAEMELLAQAALVRASRLFDAAWYVASNPDCAQASALDPVFHYVLVGSLRGADPGPWFDSAAYLAMVPEVAQSGICPLVHAIRAGAADAILAAIPS